MERNPNQKITENLVDEVNSGNDKVSNTKYQPSSNKLKVLDEFQAFPNPSEGEFEFKITTNKEISELLVEEMSGKTVAVINILATGGSVYKGQWVPAPSVQNGMYLVRAPQSTLAPIKLILKR